MIIRKLLLILINGPTKVAHRTVDKVSEIEWAVSSSSPASSPSPSPPAPSETRCTTFRIPEFKVERIDEAAWCKSHY
jgi:hypothetical protein